MLRNKENEIKEETRKSTSPMSPKKDKKHYEFGGPFGATAQIIVGSALPIVITAGCTKAYCSLKPGKLPTRYQEYLDLNVTLYFLGWVLFQAILALLPIGRKVTGPPLKYGKRIKYRCNAVFTTAVTLATYGCLLYLKVPMNFIYENLLKFASTSVLYCIVLSTILFIRSRKITPGARAPLGNTGCTVYDFFMGRELNPSLGPLDLKFFLFRLSIMSWMMLDITFVSQDCLTSGKPSLTLLLTAGMQLFYILTMVFLEEWYLTNIDMIVDGLGFMLTNALVCLMPFLYSLPTRFLLEHPRTLAYWSYVPIILTFVIGFIIFIGSNHQKLQFRRDPYNPALAHLETIPTSSGKKLLASGWWGLSRHPNYLGDFLMYVAWTLPCGFGYACPYVVLALVAGMFIVRQRRDDAICRQKYGSAWDRYCQKVHSRIVPYIY